MINLIKNEIYKIIKQKKLYIFSCISILAIILQYMGFLMVKQNNSSFEIKLQLLPLMMISSLGMIIVIYISVLMADIITDEYRNGTLKLSLIRPITRFEL